MRKKVFFGQNDVRFLYYRYKDSDYYSWSLLLAALIVSAVLVMNVVIPLVRDNFSIRQEVQVLREKIRILNENINFMNNLDRTVLNSQVQTATRALPADKDYLSILSSLSEAAVLSGVSLDDFNFSNSKSLSEESKSSVILTIVVNGDIEKVKDFLKQVNSKLPIAEVVNVENSQNSTTVSLEFFYKPYPKLSYKEDEQIRPLTDKDRELLQKLSGWQRSSNFEEFDSPEGSSSGAVPLF